jgi:hypothetical protein
MIFLALLCNMLFIFCYIPNLRAMELNDILISDNKKSIFVGPIKRSLIILLNATCEKAYIDDFPLYIPKKVINQNYILKKTFYPPQGMVPDRNLGNFGIKDKAAWKVFFAIEMNKNQDNLDNHDTETICNVFRIDHLLGDTKAQNAALNVLQKKLQNKDNLVKALKGQGSWEDLLVHPEVQDLIKLKALKRLTTRGIKPPYTDVPFKIFKSTNGKNIIEVIKGYAWYNPFSYDFVRILPLQGKPPSYVKLPHNDIIDIIKLDDKKDDSFVSCNSGGSLIFWKLIENMNKQKIKIILEGKCPEKFENMVKIGKNNVVVWWTKSFYKNWFDCYKTKKHTFSLYQKNGNTWKFDHNFTRGISNPPSEHGLSDWELIKIAGYDNFFNVVYHGWCMYWGHEFFLGRWDIENDDKSLDKEPSWIPYNKVQRFNIKGKKYDETQHHFLNERCCLTKILGGNTFANADYFYESTNRSKEYFVNIYSETDKGSFNKQHLKLNHDCKGIKEICGNKDQLAIVIDSDPCNQAYFYSKNSHGTFEEQSKVNLDDILRKKHVCEYFKKMILLPDGSYAILINTHKNIYADKPTWKEWLLYTKKSGYWSRYMNHALIRYSLGIISKSDNGIWKINYEYHFDPISFPPYTTTQGLKNFFKFRKINSRIFALFDKVNNHSVVFYKKDETDPSSWVPIKATPEPNLNTLLGLAKTLDPENLDPETKKGYLALRSPLLKLLMSNDLNQLAKAIEEQ